jgi:hypothetical protein
MGQNVPKRTSVATGRKENHYISFTFPSGLALLPEGTKAKLQIEGWAPTAIAVVTPVSINCG